MVVFLCISERGVSSSKNLCQIKMPLSGQLRELDGATFIETDAILFNSREFRVIRFLLRLLSLWRPRSAGFLESYVYPMFVNLLLLTTGPIRNAFRAIGKSTWLSVQILYIIHELVVWLGHILANRYFASRDLETNVLRPSKPLTGFSKPLKRRLKILNIAAVISMTCFFMMLCSLFVVTRFLWHEGAERFSAQFFNVHGPVDHILYCFVPISIFYNLSIGLALSWTLALLYACYAARLKILENIFLKWKHSCVDAISLFMQVYAQPVKDSWERISWWFLAHNIVALALPLYGYELAQAISGEEYHSKHLPQFICYLIFIMTIWLAPIFVGELIKRREKEFMERINDISPWLEEAENYSVQATTNDSNDLSNHSSSHDSIVSTPTERSDTGSKYDEYTFLSRGKELRNFLRFLKRRTPGLVSRGYAFQLNMSLISLTGAAISFLIELESGHEVYRNCNCTMSYAKWLTYLYRRMKFAWGGM